MDGILQVAVVSPERFIIVFIFILQIGQLSVKNGAIHEFIVIIFVILVVIVVEVLFGHLGKFVKGVYLGGGDSEGQW